MEKASRVMYSIANIFNYIVLGVFATLIVFAILEKTGVYVSGNNLWQGLAYFIVVFVVSFLIIFLTRVAKRSNSSKGWDVLFMIFGILGANIFYFLGGLFGIIAVRR